MKDSQTEKYDFLEPKLCAQIFEHDDPDRYREGWTTIYEGAYLGLQYDLNFDPVYVSDNRLSAIKVFGGNKK